MLFLSFGWCFGCAGIGAVPGSLRQSIASSKRGIHLDLDQHLHCRRRLWLGYARGATRSQSLHLHHRLRFFHCLASRDGTQDATRSRSAIDAAVERAMAWSQSTGRGTKSAEARSDKPRTPSAPRCATLPQFCFLFTTRAARRKAAIASNSREKCSASP